VADDDDACVFSDVTPTVVIDGCDSGTPNLPAGDGCTFSDEIAAAAAAATTHGEFVSSVTELMNAAQQADLISGAQKGAVVSCAAGAVIPLPPRAARTPRSWRLQPRSGQGPPE
jgi:hypothetical protein